MGSIHRLDFDGCDAQEERQARPFWRNVPMDHDACGLAFVVNRTSEDSREAMDLALEGICRLSHRGGEAFEAGDGAGLIFETKSPGPQRLLHSFLEEEARTRKKLSVGMFFFDQMESTELSRKQRRIQHILARQGVKVHGWRPVPVDDEALPTHVAQTKPCVWQVIYSPESRLPKDVYRAMLFHAQQSIE
ncbi:MAG: hypothetical protein Q8P27_02795, partial [Candidatus Peregrinibacteria bacterium]|nr:hypothetical protein [Candidatus Peregrinibacteria bacterium]